MTDSALVPQAPGGLSFGQTALDASQFIPPRVKVIQKMSQEVDTKLGVAGDFFNVLTQENYGQTFSFLPIQPFMNRVLLVRDEKRVAIENALTEGGVTNADGPKGKGPVFEFAEGGGVLKCRSLNMEKGNGEPGIACAECPLSVWHGADAPLCTEVYNVASLHENGDLIILQFSRSSAKAGRKLFSMLRLGRPGQPIWDRFYKIETKDQSNSKGTFAVPIVSKTAELPPPELAKDALRWYHELSGLGPIDVTPDDETAETEGAGYEDGDPNKPF